MGLRRRGDAVLRSRCRRALLELSAERGYAALSPGEVSERAGIDGREWRRLYADLEDCACEVLLVLRDEFVREVTASSLDKESWRDLIRAAAYSILDYFLADDARARFMLLESAGIGERAILIRDQGMDAMISLIDLGRGELDDPGTLGRSTAEGIAGAVFNRMRQIVVEGSDPVEARRMVPEMMFAVVLPYLGEDAAMEELRIPAPAAGPSLQGANL
jgi:AcrR family transcriptional regulator